MQKCVSAALLMLLMLLTGCLTSPRFAFGPYSFDVTSNPKWWGEVKLGTVVALNEDTLLDDRALVFAAKKDVPGYDSQLIFGRTITVQMFKDNPGKYWPELHLLPKDTRLRCFKLERWFSQFGSAYRVTCEVMDGECRGRAAFLIPWGDVGKKGTLHLGPHSLVYVVSK